MSPAVKVVSNGKFSVKPRSMGDVEDIQDTVPMEELAADPREDRHAYIPEASYAKKYVNRKIEGIKDFDLIDFCLKNQKNLIMRGDTGAGKTMMPMAYAAAHGIAYYSVPCDVSIDPTALFGKLMPTDTIGKFEWADGPVTELVRYGGILNISEINFMPAKIAASLYQLLDHRRSLTLLGHKGETIRAHKKLLIVADMNPKYRGTVELNAAFANRFHVKVDWDYDANVENLLIPSPALLGMVRNIRKLDGIRTPIGTNVMQEFLSVASTLGYNFAVKNFVGQFDPSERDAVNMAFKTAEANLKRELASIKAGSTPDKDMAEMDADDEWFKEEGDPNDFEFEEDVIG